MKPVVTCLMLLAVLAACAPAVSNDPQSIFPIKTGETWIAQFNKSAETTRVDFTLSTAPVEDTDRWIYADFKTSEPIVTGNGAIPDDRKSLIVVFALDPKITQQLVCVVPLNIDFRAATKGSGMLFEKDRKLAEFPCSLTRK